MYKANVKVNTNLEVEVSAEDEAGLFKEIARAQELYAFNKCGVCGNENINFRCRIDRDENEWMEICCMDLTCRAKLPFGTTKKGGQIYPKTRWNHLSETQQQQRAADEDYAEKHNGYLPNGGWFIYKK